MENGGGQGTAYVLIVEPPDQWQAPHDALTFKMIVSLRAAGASVRATNYANRRNATCW
jgi:hypothetical protein